jgi:phosphoenolpyruvate carboxylase
VTKEVVLRQRLRLCRLYLQDLSELESQLAISTRFSPAMLELSQSIPESTTTHKIELYRRVIAHLRLRLVKTSEEIEDELAMFLEPKEVTFIRSHRESSGAPTDRTSKSLVGESGVILKSVTKADDLLVPLRTMYESLSETGFQAVADGKLKDIITRLKVFGVSIPLDLRQESSRHTAALDKITRSLGLGSYAEWSEEARLNFLSSELAGKRPLFRSEELDRMDFDDQVRDTLETFQMASELEPETLGAYVISQCQTASDVLAVMLLQKQFGMTSANNNMMRVVPLFETLDDLKNAPERLKTLFSISAYVGAIKGKQEVMVGCE